jgi:hypothetical protein
MLLSLKYKFLFVHIAKTGGTSVRSALMYRKWADPYYLPQFVCSKLSKLTGHRIGAKFPRHAKAIAAREMLPRELYDELFKFAFVRNPWDLQVSSWHHIRRERPHLLEGISDFVSFLQWKLDPERPYQYIIDTSITLQNDYLVDLHGKRIVDFIGRYETLEQDYGQVCARVGIPYRQLPHKRKATDRDDYRRYYNERTIELVARHFRADVEELGYTFD